MFFHLIQTTYPKLWLLLRTVSAILILVLTSPIRGTYTVHSNCYTRKPAYKYNTESTATKVNMQGQEPMQYTQPEAEGSFDHAYQTPSMMQQTQLPQLRTPNYNQQQQIRSCETTATKTYMQSQEPMQYTQPEADGSSDHPHQKPM